MLETITTDLTWSGLTGPSDRAHLHSGPEGTPTDGTFFHEVIQDTSVIGGPVACSLDPTDITCAPESGSLHDVLDVLTFNGGVFGLGYWNCPTFQCIIDLSNGGNMFLDMHTSFRSVELNLNYSLGEIRGQLSPLAVETPEPATTGLFAAGLLLLGAKAIWQRRKPGRS